MIMSHNLFQYIKFLYRIAVTQMYKTPWLFQALKTAWNLSFKSKCLILFCRRKLAFARFTQKIQYFASFVKLIREMPLFWNSIFLKSSFNITINSLKCHYRYEVIKKKKKNLHGTRVPKRHYRAPEFFFFFF